MRLELKVVPNASRDEISGWLGRRLKVRVSVPAESGKANRAVIALLAGVLGCQRRDIRLITGTTSAAKSVEIDVDDVLVRARLDACLEGTIAD